MNRKSKIVDDFYEAIKVQYAHNKKVSRTQMDDSADECFAKSEYKIALSMYKRLFMSKYNPNSVYFISFDYVKKVRLCYEYLGNYRMALIIQLIDIANNPINSLSYYNAARYFSALGMDWNTLLTLSLCLRLCDDPCCNLLKSQSKIMLSEHIKRRTIEPNLVEQALRVNVASFQCSCSFRAVLWDTLYDLFRCQNVDEDFKPFDPCFAACYLDMIKVFLKWKRFERALTFYEILAIADPTNQSFPVGIATCWGLVRKHLDIYPSTHAVKASDLVLWAIDDLKTISSPGLASLNIEHYCPLSFIYYLNEIV